MEFYDSKSVRTVIVDTRLIKNIKEGGDLKSSEVRLQR